MTNKTTDTVFFTLLIFSFQYFWNERTDADIGVILRHLCYQFKTTSGLV